MCSALAADGMEEEVLFWAFNVLNEHHKLFVSTSNEQLWVNDADAETADTITTCIDKLKIINKKSNADLCILDLDTIVHISLPFVFLTTFEFDRSIFMCWRSGVLFLFVSQ